MTSSDPLFEQVEVLIKKHGSLRVTHDPGGSGMGYYYTASVSEWPCCSSSSLVGSLTVLVKEHLRLEKEALQKRINEIDESSAL